MQTMGPVARCFLLLCWSALGALAHAQAGERIALVVGNSAYSQSPLSNPHNDAQAMSALLRRAGFMVDQQLDTTQAQLTSAVARFGQAIKDPKVKFGLFYYAGHGLQLEWRNYLVPVSADIRSAEDVRKQTVDVSALLSYMGQAKGRSFLVILDACRDDPFAGSYRPSAKGLSQFDAPVGSLLAYATAPGSVALDGEGENGLYTGNLVREFSVPGVRVEDAFKRVRLNVRLASRGQQIPWESTSLEDDVYLFPSARRKLSDEEQDQQLEQEIASWLKVKSSRDPEQLADFIRQYPSGSASELAQSRLSRLLAQQARQEAVQVAVAVVPGAPIVRDGQAQIESARQKAQEAEAQRQAAEREAQARQEAAAAAQAQREAELAAARRREEEQAQAVRLEDQRLQEAQAKAAQLERERLAALEQARQQEAARLEAQRLAAAREQALREAQERAQAVQRAQAQAAAEAAAAAQAQREAERAQALRREQEQAQAVRLENQRLQEAQAKAAQLERERLAALEQARQQEAARLEAQRLAAAREQALREAQAREQALRQAQAQAAAAAAAAREAELQREAQARAEAQRVEQARAEMERRREQAREAQARLAAEQAKASQAQVAAAPVETAGLVLAPTPYSQGYREHRRSYQAGDVYSYRVIDAFTRVSRPLVYQVTAVDMDGDRVEYNNGEYLSDSMGNIVANPRGGMSTPRQFYPAELFVGKRWRTTFKQSRASGMVYTFQYDMKVTGRETVTVPAGTFDTFKIEARGYNMQLGARLERNIWVAAGVSGDIVHETLVRLRNGSVEQNDRQELVSYTAAGSRPAR